MSGLKRRQQRKGGRGYEEEEEEGACWRSQSRQACMRARERGSGPDRACPPGDLPTPAHLTDRVIIKLHAS